MRAYFENDIEVFVHESLVVPVTETEALEEDVSCLHDILHVLVILTKETPQWGMFKNSTYLTRFNKIAI